MRNDTHGITFSPTQAKLYYNGSHSLAMKTSWVTGDRYIFIITYTIYQIRELSFVLYQRPKGRVLKPGAKPGNPSVRIICDTRFSDKAEELLSECPNTRIRYRDNVHSKIILIEPKFIIIGSQNLSNDSPLHETSVTFHSKKAFTHYFDQAFRPLWKNSDEVEGSLGRRTERDKRFGL